jgi:signal transduction histidine kinase
VRYYTQHAGVARDENSRESDTSRSRDLSGPKGAVAMMKSEDAPHTPSVGPDRAVRGVGELAGELTHALKNPVAAFTTSLDLLLGGNLDADDVKALHRVLRNELRKLDEMLLRTRELTRLRSLQRRPMDLAELLRARLDVRAPDLAAAEAKVERSGLDEPVRVFGDPELLEHAFDALLQNAIDAGGNGATVRVALAMEGHPGKQRAVIRVRDEGAGIPEVARANVFRMFYTTRQGAAGMGLPVARWIAIAHEGEVVLEPWERGIEAVMTVGVDG